MRWDVLQWTTIVWNPRANPDERRNQDVKKCLNFILVGKNAQTWDDQPSEVCSNSRKNAATGE